MTVTKELLEVCANHTRESSDEAVFAEPYLPYIPSDWNGVLVLAEAQNLSKRNQAYVDYLEGMKCTEDRMTRLQGPDSIGITPWDDGSLKLAVEAAVGVRAVETAVGNSVLWSRRKEDGANANPSREMMRWSVLFWNDLLPLLQPKHLILAGKVAREVADALTWKGCKSPFRLPSPQAMSRVSGMFDKNDLLKRYPEVSAVVDRNPAWLEDRDRKKGLFRNKVYFACHAVSLFQSNQQAD